MDRYETQKFNIQSKVIDQLKKELEQYKRSTSDWECMYWQLNDIETAKIKELENKLSYYKLYVEFLVGSISKDEFKKIAVTYAEPLNIEAAVALAKKEDLNHD